MCISCPVFTHHKASDGGAQPGIGDVKAAPDQAPPGKKKQQDIACLLLRETAALRFTAKVRQELLGLLLAHFLGMPLAVKQNVALDPVYISAFGTDVAKLETNFITSQIR